MQAQLLPLFPLPVVVFPRTRLPLHIFEDRYKEMIGEAIRDRSEFGVVLAQENGIVNAGCTVIVEEVLNRYPDGRMDVLTCGVRRFEISSLNEEKSFLRGEVQYFDDEDPDAPAEELQHRALDQYKSWLAVGEPRPYGEALLTDRQLSFQIVHGLPDKNFLQVLLRNRSERERLKQVVDYLLQYLPKLRFTARMKQLAPTNGHGRRDG